mmetsp:Transcript_79158/g.144390  ORF Transcript_79158/g.144390 Transcript_79158/m.144390 type:complete len:141 (+) Transcript_79158:138-560(+)
MCVGTCNATPSRPLSLGKMSSPTWCRTPPSCHAPTARSHDGYNATPRYIESSPDVRQAIKELDALRNKLKKNSVTLALAQLDVMQCALEQNARTLASLKNQVADSERVARELDFDYCDADAHSLDIAINGVEGKPGKLSL